MQADILQATQPTIVIKVYLSDHVTPATGKTVAITISVNKAAFANPSVGATNATEIGNGWYYYTPSTTDTGTIGPLIVLGTASGCDNSDQAYHVTKATNRGMSAIPDTAATTNASLLTSGTGTDQLSVAAGKVLLQATQSGVTIPTVTTVGTLTTYTGNTPQTGDSFARLGAPAGASISADIAAVKSETDTILTDVNTGGGAIYARLGAPAGASMSADIASVKTSVGSVTGAVGSVTASVTIGAYASGQDPATLVLGATQATWVTAGTVGLSIAQAGGDGPVVAIPNFEFFMSLSSDHFTAAIGKTITATRSTDGGAFVACSNSATEVGSGVYKIDLSITDLTFTSSLMLQFAASGCDSTFYSILA